ncbi:MAG: hypothetical protein IKQ61_03505, partial [Spirochaetales bacterium]|nr:hypothetical protein [Spirochaetales bacterium]
MNKKRIWVLAAVSVLLLGLSGCPSETAGSQTSVGTTQTTNGNGGQTPPTVPNDGTKISSLQIAINEAKEGDTIDLSQYASIENFDYKATVNKAVTLTNGNDLGGAALTVVSDGVKLNGIKNASVTTNSSLKISGSSLSCLSIASVASSTPSANQIVSRGETVLSAQPPVVEVTDTTVAEDVSVGIANAYLTVEKFTASTHVSLDAANVQLTISDKATNIKEIKTDKICQVILEDGTSDTIPCSLDKISVTGSGELKQIDMRAAGSMKLLALTPMSGLTTVAKQGEPIDFSTIVLLGTYQA